MAEQGAKPVWKWVGAGAVLAAAGAVAWYARERLAEEPRFRLVEEDGDIELRDYPALLVAETIAPGTRQPALSEGFRRLAGFIRGGSQREGKIAMTAPVLAAAVPGGWRTRFVMPAARGRASLPAPPSGIAIASLPERRVAAIRFGGVPDDARLAGREAVLRNWMHRRGLIALGDAEHAFYNSPAIPGPLRRSEVLIPTG
ncbi:SOUL family heme-binding protein [Sphingomonas sanxanigenens]|nr:heme-binding protein [Sphingomonas sanxanigenens]